MDFIDPREFDDPQVYDDDLKGISIGSTDFDIPKLYSDTSILDGFVCKTCDLIHHNRRGHVPI